MSDSQPTLESIEPIVKLILFVLVAGRSIKKQYYPDHTGKFESEKLLYNDFTVKKSQRCY